MTPIIIIPIEIKSRELPSKLYFASEAIKRGYEVWVGHAYVFHKYMEAFPKGIVVENDIGPGSGYLLAKARQLGHYVVAWDEESIVVKDDEFYIDERLPYQNLANCHKFFTRGNIDKSLIAKRYPDLSHLLYAAGNPRIDILKNEYVNLYKVDMNKYKKPIILFNSRFSHSNPYHMSREKFRVGSIKKLNLVGDALQFKKEYMDYTDKVFDEYCNMVKKVPAHFPEYQFILRPHPSENHAVWHEIAKSNDNFEVNYSHTAMAWALNSKAVIHSGCTTALEAALLGRKTIAYRNITSDKYDLDLPNLVSENVYSFDNLLKSIKKLSELDDTSESKIREEAIQKLSFAISNIHPDGNNSTLFILDELASSNISPKRTWKQHIHCLKHHFDYFLSKDKIHFFDKANNDKLNLSDYAKHKFPNTSVEEIKEILNVFDGENIVVTKPYQNWFILSGSK